MIKYRIRTLAIAAVLAVYTGTCCISSAKEEETLDSKSVSELETMKTKNNLKLQEIQSSIEKSRKEYESASKTESARKEYRDKLNEKITLQNQTLECIVRQINMLEDEVQDTNEMLEEIRTEISQYQEESDETLETYKQRLRADYMSGTDNISAVLTGSSSFFDILTRAELILRISARDQNTLSSLEKKLEKLKELNDQLTFKQEIISSNLDEAEIKKSELDEKLDELKADFNQTQEELEKVSGDKINFKKDYDAQKAALEEQRKEQEKITAAIKEAMEKEAEQARKQAAAVSTVNSSSGNSSGSSSSSVGGSYTVSGATQINVSSDDTDMLWPVPGYTSHSSFYGYREFDNSDHKAIDIQGNANDTIEFAKIYAAESGTVITAVNYCEHSYGKNYSCGCGGGYGNYIVLQHSDGVYQTVYAHCYTIYVSEGDTVRKGQLIGLVGSTGYSTGPHLHFEVRRNGEKTNPDSYTYINYG